LDIEVEASPPPPKPQEREQVYAIRQKDMIKVVSDAVLINQQRSENTRDKKLESPRKFQNLKEKYAQYSNLSGLSKKSSKLFVIDQKDESHSKQFRTTRDLKIGKSQAVKQMHYQTRANELQRYL